MIVRFIGRVSKSGTDRNVIIIPKELKAKTDEMRGAHVIVVIEEILVNGELKNE